MRSSAFRALLAIVVAAAGAACASRGGTPPVIAPHPAPTSLAVTTVRVRTGAGPDAAIHVLALEEYVRGVVLAEIAPRGVDRPALDRMLELQAILARTYALANRGRHGADGFDLCSTTHCQVFRSPGAPGRRADAIARAVTKTAREVIIFDGRPIQALFHADCAGRTSAADRIWGGRPVPYLQPVSDDVHAGRRTWTAVLSADTLREALNADPRTAVGGRLDAVTILERDAAGRALRLVLDGERAPMVRGEELRAVLNRARPDGGAILSTAFTVRREAGRFVFEGRGHGHGAGLCQTGAMARAQAGEPPEQIAQDYYPGTSVARIW